MDSDYTKNDLYSEDVQVHFLKSIDFYLVLNRFLDTYLIRANCIEIIYGFYPYSLSYKYHKVINSLKL
ncbi:hypothetical protein B1J93_18050 [Leptospira kirschneri serovar Pomona]|uniref:Uncharacterized protein n=1 Tax=Leptospira kirschneri serovar Pomona TaxID=561005 RepID=A0A1T1DH99_9LEPT|nr:hypothetical protein B1J93_18050 [Leptospira kirschneri serovar Pomona]